MSDTEHTHVTCVFDRAQKMAIVLGLKMLVADMQRFGAEKGIKPENLRFTCEESVREISLEEVFGMIHNMENPSSPDGYTSHGETIQ